MAGNLNKLQKDSKTEVRAFATFSGGGAQGIALAGAYQAACDQGFQFRGYGGTSAGAMIAVLAAAGLTGAEILSMSLAGKPGHPSNFFSDPAYYERRRFLGIIPLPRRHAPRRLSDVLDEWDSLSSERVKGPAPKRRRYHDPQVEPAATDAHEDHESDDAARSRYAPLWRVFDSAAVVGLLALGVFLAWTLGGGPAIYRWNGLDLHLGQAIGIGATLLAVILYLWLQEAFLPLRLAKPSRLAFILGKWGVIRRELGFIRGKGMERAFNAVLQEKLEAAFHDRMAALDAAPRKAKERLEAVQEALAKAHSMLKELRSGFEAAPDGEEKSQLGEAIEEIERWARHTAEMEKTIKHVADSEERRSAQWTIRLERFAAMSPDQRPLFSNIDFQIFDFLFECQLKIVATDIWSGRALIFSSDNPETAEAGVFEAVRASTAFPLAFSPVVYRRVGLGPSSAAAEETSPSQWRRLQRLAALRRAPKDVSAQVREYVLVDGGVASNSPAFLFHKESEVAQSRTIAFQLSYSFPGPRFPATFSEYARGITRALVGAGDNIIQNLVPRVFVVPVSGLESYGVLNGDLSSRAVRRLYQLGASHNNLLRWVHKICAMQDGLDTATEEDDGVDDLDLLISGLRGSFRALLDEEAELCVSLWQREAYDGRWTGWKAKHLARGDDDVCAIGFIQNRRLYLPTEDLSDPQPSRSDDLDQRIYKWELETEIRDLIRQRRFTEAVVAMAIADERSALWFDDANGRGDGAAHLAIPIKVSSSLQSAEVSVRGILGVLALKITPPQGAKTRLRGWMEVDEDEEYLYHTPQFVDQYSTWTRVLGKVLSA